MNQPLVTAVMVTGKSIDRLPFALASIRAFRQQTWKNKELRIVMDGEREFHDAIIREIDGKECMTNVRTTLVGDGSRSLTLGELRNIGLDRADGDWIIQWDDDDWYHPQRIEYQMRHRKPGHAVLLEYQVRYDTHRDVAFRARYKDGIAGTILHPRTDQRYPAERKHEDSHFLTAAFGQNRVIVDNKDFAEVYVRFFNGANTWDAKHIMGPFVRSPAGHWTLPPPAETYLEGVLKREYQKERTKRRRTKS